MVIDEDICFYLESIFAKFVDSGKERGSYDSIRKAKIWVSDCVKRGNQSGCYQNAFKDLE